MRKTYITTIKEFLDFSLNLNAEYYGYNVDAYADWKTRKENIKDIFMLETYLLFAKANETMRKSAFFEWVNDMDCIINVLANYDYCDKYALNNMLPKRMHKAHEDDKVNFINNEIYKLLFS